MGKGEVHTGVFVERPEVKGPLGRTRFKWDDDNQMNPKETCWEAMSWIDVAQDRDK
jgi:hypothetical protein